LVGGSCKMPAVRLYLQHSLKKDVAFLGSPDTIVALGAGTYAGIKERQAEVKDMLLTDVCPFTLGIDVKDMMMSPIIERNTALPVSIARRYVTRYDNQKEINIGVYQGEAPNVNDNIQLGQLKVSVPPAEAGKESVLVRFTYDINGILEVNVMVDSTSVEKHLVIVDEKNVMSQKEINQRLKELACLKIHPREREENTYLLARCEALYAQAGTQLREFLMQEMEYFNYQLEKQDELRLKKGRKRFESAMNAAEDNMKLFDIESKFDSFSEKWYEEAREEELDIDHGFEDWFGKGHFTS
ncbi:MAG: Hsp70 family protein, partial [Hespellia sp.]|nr:Hsp70 family protein [Hespellia sp.]